MNTTITKSEPGLPGEDNAKAKLASIIAAHQLEIWANDRETALIVFHQARVRYGRDNAALVEVHY